ncbi:hypothetical protein ACLFKQ_11795 [Myxosarcina sp. GI1(2024)]
MDTIVSDFGKYQNSYTISDICFARKADLDNFILNGAVGSGEYARASVLYALYACRYLTVTDIEYPTYQVWKTRHGGLNLDHKLPRKWFPELTFDCTNWRPVSKTVNISKGDDFLDEGLERLQLLASELNRVRHKYS